MIDFALLSKFYIPKNMNISFCGLKRFVSSSYFESSISWRLSSCFSAASHSLCFVIAFTFSLLIGQQRWPRDPMYPGPLTSARLTGCVLFKEPLLDSQVNDGWWRTLHRTNE